MKIRAAIFDVYGTLMEIGPPPPDPDASWRKLFQETFGTQPSFGWLDYSAACKRVVERQHTDAKALGISFPEIVWPSIVREVIPAFSKLSSQAREEFIFQQVQIGRSLRLFPEAGRELKRLSDKGCALGIASNAQQYTLRELSEALSGSGTDFNLFDRTSFQGYFPSCRNS